MILYVPLIPTCEPLLNFFWIRPCDVFAPRSLKSTPATSAFYHSCDDTFLQVFIFLSILLSHNVFEVSEFSNYN